MRTRHNLERYLSSLPTKDLRDAIREMAKKHREETPIYSQTYTIECPHCRKFFEFQLEVKR